MKYHRYEVCVGALLCFLIMGLTATVTAAQGVDHSPYAGLLKKYVKDGVVDYNGFKNDKTDNALYKHKHNVHGNEEIKFSMEITRRFRDPLSRRANEAVRISSREKHELLNSKNEFNHPPIARICVDRNKNKNNFKNIIHTVQPGL